ncbi:PH domain-containing protein [Patescibacteria group bacterium]|nr:PH domain-containing protein [Patescibacteria group bacterium]
MDEFSKVLDPTEQVLWSGNPQFFPYMVQALFGMFSGFIFFLFGYIAVKAQGGAPTDILPYIFMGIGFLIMVGGPVYSYLVYKYIMYKITDKRVLFQKGLIGRDFDIVDFDKIENLTVNVGLVDKLFGNNSGTIDVFSNRLQSRGSGRHRRTVNVPFRLVHITDPYAVLQLIKKSSFDVKADVNFPNALRPDNNEGYNTQYTSQS